MEVRETAACGVAEREFAIDLVEREIVPLHKFLVEARNSQIEGPQPDLIDEIIAQMRQIVGPVVDQ